MRTALAVCLALAFHGQTTRAQVPLSEAEQAALAELTEAHAATFQRSMDVPGFGFYAIHNPYAYPT